MGSIKFHIIGNDTVHKSIYVRDSELGLFFTKPADVLWVLLACVGCAVVGIMLSRHCRSPRHINFVHALGQTHVSITQSTQFARIYMHTVVFILSFITHIL